jgi:hypothetical protein
MTTEAIELADMIDRSEETTGFERRMASVLRSQAAEIERLNMQLLSASGGTKDREHAEEYFRQAEKLLTANEQTLHAEIERLREILARALAQMRTQRRIDRAEFPSESEDEIKTELGGTSMSNEELKRLALSMDYLQREGLCGPPLRDAPNAGAEPREASDSGNLLYDTRKNT